jgi:flavin-dependent trigonelline monooxygenase, oxygenase component
MKFSLFAHMERISPEQPHRVLYEEFLELCRMADEGGMRAVWSGEHHAMDFTIAPNPFITLTDLARRTRNVRLGTGTVVAPFWHPIRLAREGAMTDIITDGRLEIGIARGAYSYEYERLMPGMDAWQAGARMREIVPTLRRLWEGDYAHEGEFFRFPATTSAPRPLQPGGPPLWIAARDPASHEFAVENGCHVQVTPLAQGDEEVASLMQRFNAACEKLAPVTRPKIMVLQHAYVAGSDAETEQAARDLSRFYCYFGAWFRNERPVRQALIETLSDAEMQAMEMYSPERMRANMAIGRPREVIERIRRYEDLGYDEYAMWIDSGMDTETKRASLSRFIDEVMPAFG